MAARRAALLEYEVLGGKLSIRRACVVSQAISIAATSFCAKLEMMARYGAVRYGDSSGNGTVRYSTIWCDTVRCGAVR